MVEIKDETVTERIKLLFKYDKEKAKTFLSLVDSWETIYLLIKQGKNLELLKCLECHIDDPSFLYQAIRSGDMETLKYCNENYEGVYCSWIKDAVYKSLKKYENIEGGQQYLMEIVETVNRHVK